MDPEEIKEFNKLVEKAKSDLTYPHDGQVTKFVVIGRAIDLARAGKYNQDFKSFKPDILSKALDSVLEGELE